MKNQTYSLRHFRSFRIPVSQSDRVKVKIEGTREGSQLVFEGDDLKIENMSLSGLAIWANVKIPKLENVLVHIEFKNSVMTIPGRIARQDSNSTKGSALAIEYDFSERGMAAKFLESFIQSFSGKRLKAQLINLLKSEESAAALQTSDLYPAVIQMLEEFGGYKDLPGLDVALIEATKIRFGFTQVEFKHSEAGPFTVRDLDGRTLGALKVSPAPRELGPEAHRGVVVLAQLLGHIYDRPECGLHEESVRFLQPKAPRKYVMIGSSQIMGSLRDMVSKAKFNQSAVFVSGEFGVGKTLLAKVIHSESTNAAGPFHIIDLGQSHTPQTLSEAFAALEEAEGTLVLREISMLTAGALDVVLAQLLQLPKTWRVVATSQLSYRDFCRKYGRLDFKAICDLEIEVPSLSERREDIPDLLGFFVKRECLQRGIRPKKMTKDLVHFVKHMDFDHNIYGLKLFASRMVELNLNAKVLNFTDGHRLGLLEDEQFQLTHFEEVIAKYSHEDLSSVDAIVNEYAFLSARAALASVNGDQDLAIKRLGLESVAELNQILAHSSSAKKVA